MHLFLNKRMQSAIAGIAFVASIVVLGNCFAQNSPLITVNAANTSLSGKLSFTQDQYNAAINWDFAGENGK
ncbi:hypothetical protein [Nostoc sp.]|uniref:hypothetical protein n=1 Tax=Nostoc sp. TaxID=1180 RepID=UPI002FFD3976